MPEVVYEEVVEVAERVVLVQDGCRLPRKDPKRIVTGRKLDTVMKLLDFIAQRSKVKVTMPLRLSKSSQHYIIGM